MKRYLVIALAFSWSLTAVAEPRLSLTAGVVHQRIHTRHSSAHWCRSAPPAIVLLPSSLSSVVSPPQDESPRLRLVTVLGTGNWRPAISRLWLLADVTPPTTSASYRFDQVAREAGQKVEIDVHSFLRLSLRWLGFNVSCFFSDARDGARSGNAPHERPVLAAR